MFPQLILFLAFYSLTVHAADVLTFKIADFQGNMLDLSSGSPNSLTPVQSFKNTNETRQNWKFFYAARGDENEYRVQNVAAPASILSYTTADITTPGGAEHTQIVGKQNVSTFWDIMPVAGKKGFSKCAESLPVRARELSKRRGIQQLHREGEQARHDGLACWFWQQSKFPYHARAVRCQESAPGVQTRCTLKRNACRRWRAQSGLALVRKFGAHTKCLL
ncbi:hypothetical protein C8F04DRAFT_1121300 [Mycena alexandri]|uniref:Ricin B lectin domain-containing protein n=1 Tax=Mycena alexandri TaxID=1745969 RepID=A0AAD6WUH4_9AGAR|nr:hypothetical protein C8F04DRAFT_1121300 [Mycena alexandri]